MTHEVVKPPVSEKAALQGIDPRRTGRPPKPLPANAEQLIEDMARESWSIITMAKRMGVDKKTFYGWLQRHENLKEAIERGREGERVGLHQIVHRIAEEGENEKNRLLAAMYLLNSRHNYRTDHPTDQENRVSITISLPAPRPLADFIDMETRDGSEPHCLPTARS